jgi:hypothetical protein
MAQEMPNALQWDAAPCRIRARRRTEFGKFGDEPISKVKMDMKIPRRLLIAVAIFFLFGVVRDCPAQTKLHTQAEETLRQAVAQFRELAVNGGYVYYYSLDGQRRLGEGVARPTEVWVQPPGTPSVGIAFLNAYGATGEDEYLVAATEAGLALAYGQLKSGGWTSSIDFDRQGPRIAQYRNGRGGGSRNNSTFDDNTSQAALRFLMALDQAHRSQHQEIHECVAFGLDAAMDAQFPNGAFPQIWTGPNSAGPSSAGPSSAGPSSAGPSSVQDHNVLAAFPTYDWRTKGRIKEYWNLYTLNDGAAGSITELLSDAHQIYGEAKYLDAAKRLGDFLVQAQLPAPQPGWAQQYNYQMHPVWARKFEPPAIAGRESQGVIRTLLKLYEKTGDERYLSPIPAALRYLESSQLPDGRLARYYELKTNRPLYMQRDGKKYSLTYDSSRLPDHYGWIVESEVAQLRAAYTRASRGEKDNPSRDLKAAAVRAIESNAAGRWISFDTGQPLVGQPKFRPDEPFLASAVFAENANAICEWLSSLK